MKPTFTNPYLGHERGRYFSTDFKDDPGMTQQSDAKDCDINVIMAKYTATGQIPRQLMQPLYGDFSEPMDYQEAVTRIRSAEEAFLEIPAKIRLQFGNDPGEFIKFCTDPQNKDKLRELGLHAPIPEPSIEEKTLEAIKDLKPKETQNGTGPK